MQVGGYDRFIREAETRYIAGGVSANTLRAWEMAGDFPRRVKLGRGRAVGWSFREVMAWKDERDANAKARLEERKPNSNAWIKAVQELADKAA